MYPLTTQYNKIKEWNKIINYPNTQAAPVDLPYIQSTILYLGANRYVHEVSLSLGTIGPPF